MEVGSLDTRRRRIGLLVPFEEDATRFLEGEFEIHHLKDPEAARLKTGDAGYYGLVVGPRVDMSAKRLKELTPALQILSSFTAGIENIDVDAAEELGIAVASTRSLVVEPTADIAMMLITATLRRAGEAMAAVRNSEWKRGRPFAPRGMALEGATLGIVGMGGIGRAVARRARASGMKILYHNRSQLNAGDEGDAEFTPRLSDLLGRSDAVSLHCPLTSLTRRLISADRLAEMKPEAVLVNTARGELVDDDALIAALQGGRLAAAGLDVFANEPDIASFYRQSDKVIALPHMGTATPLVRRSMKRRALENIATFFRGKAMTDLVTKDPRAALQE